MKQYKNVNELWGAIVNGDMDPSVSDFSYQERLIFIRQRNFQTPLINTTTIIYY